MSFSTEFLGCKISHSDVQGVRERLLAGGLEAVAREVGANHVRKRGGVEAATLEQTDHLALAGRDRPSDANLHDLSPPRAAQ